MNPPFVSGSSDCITSGNLWQHSFQALHLVNVGVVNLVQKPDAWRLEGILLGQPDEHPPGASFVRSVLGPAELDHKLVHAFEDGHLKQE